jgi:SIR2-like domain
MHDKTRIIQDLHESLSLDKHPVAILLGAGCPQAVRVINDSGKNIPIIPDVTGLTNHIKETLKDDPAFSKLLSHFTEDGKNNFTIEDLLSHVRLLSRVVGKGDARGIDKIKLDELEGSICSTIAKVVNKSLTAKDSPYHLLAQWIRGVRRNTPVTLFTTNYDLLMEQALEEEYIPYFDGFVGSRNPFFDVSAIEEDNIPTRWTRLWKLHGSINWQKGPGNDGMVVRSQGPSRDGGVLIHPSEMKYDQSRKMPTWP